ncbi:hypothetical protein [Enterococcus gallinarum]|uniref:Phage protein n=1 Tax=Enterococcus gallinarum TaxID=1353 RepID=A0ABD4ZWY5_ENTGA|nr:hypothetical protein [Enterococcus gallinarum]MBF0726247.1 hypothetical protein [Enterococcus gallinarum]MBX8979349.1 hypothetical protein [Enterococcus gallinarum]MCR1932095.1 hypothetical protein [Enterococcus gallinarum]MCR1945979.1 hypothetical protein [Enterococcus gallinarum]MDL4876622.1 hypothetical protein [Enterococcus gallinarum]
MDYHQNLKNATTVKEVQKFYNEGFKDMVAKIEEKFISEGRGQQLVYADGYIDPILTIADAHLLICAEYRAEQLSKNKSEGPMIKSNHDSFIEERLIGLKRKKDTESKEASKK